MVRTRILLTRSAPANPDEVVPNEASGGVPIAPRGRGRGRPPRNPRAERAGEHVPPPMRDAPAMPPLTVYDTPSLLQARPSNYSPLW